MPTRIQRTMIKCDGKTSEECYKCDKKGHPATACTAKVVHTDDDKKSTKSSKSSKSASVAEIRKSMKSMGKAMTQLGELADFNKKLFDEELHAQLGTVDVKMPGVMSEYSFAARKALLLDKYPLLDNQSLVQIMCNPVYVENIPGLGRKMVLKSNGGRLPVLILKDLKKRHGFHGTQQPTYSLFH